MSANTTAITDTAFKSEVLDSDKPVLVDFWAAWCQPCKMLAPTMDQLATDYAGKAKVGKVNIDENPETAAAYGIRSIPSVLVFHKGKVAEQLVGLLPKERYREVLDRILKQG